MQEVNKGAKRVMHLVSYIRTEPSRIAVHCERPSYVRVLECNYPERRMGNYSVGRNGRKRETTSDKETPSSPTSFYKEGSGQGGYTASKW